MRESPWSRPREGARERRDGALVLQARVHAQGRVDTGLWWICCYGPEPERREMRLSKGGAAKFRTAAEAMAAIDREFPLAASPPPRGEAPGGGGGG